MATATITFDQPSYSPSGVVHFTVSVDAPMTDTRTFTGSVELADGTVLPATSQTTVTGLYGPFTADGYTVAQDTDNPAAFTATPTPPGP